MSSIDWNQSAVFAIQRTQGRQAMTNQYNLVRRSRVCPNCGKEKDEGLILCWPCHHSQKNHNNGGYSKRLEYRLTVLEKKLSGAANV